MSGGVNYTPEEDQRIREMRGERKTAKEIAAVIGRSFYSVHHRLHTLGIKLKRKEGRKYERIVVSRDRVVDVYERGWRFVGFDAGMCVFERAIAHEKAIDVRLLKDLKSECSGINTGGSDANDESRCGSGGCSSGTVLAVIASDTRSDQV